jgi:hypothetical protein
MICKKCFLVLGSGSGGGSGGGLVGNLDHDVSVLEGGSVELESLLLLLLAAKSDESISSAGTVSSLGDISVGDLESLEDSAQLVVINREGQVGDIDHGGRGLAGLLGGLLSVLVSAVVVSSASVIVSASASVVVSASASVSSVVVASVSSVATSVIVISGGSLSGCNSDGDHSVVHLRLVESVKSLVLVLGIVEFDEAKSSALAILAGGDVGGLDVELAEDLLEVVVIEIEGDVGDIEGVLELSGGVSVALVVVSSGSSVVISASAPVVISLSSVVSSVVISASVVSAGLVVVLSGLVSSVVVGSPHGDDSLLGSGVAGEDLELIFLESLNAGLLGAEFNEAKALASSVSPGCNGCQFNIQAAEDSLEFLILEGPGNVGHIHHGVGGGSLLGQVGLELFPELSLVVSSGVIEGDLGGDLSSIDLLSIDLGDGDVLLGVLDEIHKTKSLASSVSALGDVSSLDIVTLEELSELLISGGERQIGNIDHGLGGFLFFRLIRHWAKVRELLAKRG